MGQDADTRQSSPGETLTSKDKALFSSTSRSHKLRDRVVALRAERATEQMRPTSCAHKMESAHSVHSCPPKISKSHILRGQFQKEPRGVEELVKYMSEVPAYLQLLESGNTNQEKALNMGVLDWGHLQKWTDCRRPLKTQHEAVSPTFGSISSPCGSNSGLITHGVKQIHSVQSPWGSSLGKDCDRCEALKKTSNQLANFLGSNTTPERRHQQHNSWGLIKENAHGNDSVLRVEKFTPITSDGSTCSSHEVNTSLSMSSECEIPSSSEVKEGHCSRLRTNSIQVPPGGQFNGIFCAKDGIQDCLPRNDHCVEALHIYSQDVPNGDPRFILYSTVSENNEVQASGGGYFSGVLSEHVSFEDLCSDVPHSCPLPAYTEGCGWSETNIGASGNCDGASFNTCNLPGWLDVPKTSRFRCNLEKTDNFASQPPKLMGTTRKADSVPEDIVEAGVAKARETFPGLSWVSRSSSLKEIEVGRPAKGNACLDVVYADKTTATSRARRSPLRRILDPLLKSRMSFHCPESVSNSPTSFVPRLSFSDKSGPKGETEMQDCQDSSPNGRASSSASQQAGRLTFSAWACESQSALQDGKHERSKMQALLRLAWKNDLPLFTFSINDDDILVATRKKIFSDKQDVECAYTFYYVRENKRKSGWRNQGNKTRRQELVSKVVGRMKVSCAYDSESSGRFSATHFSVREFILFGAEIRPTVLETPKFLPESEIAAIVIKSLKDGADICSDSPHQKEHCSVSTSQSKNMDISVSSNIVAILPSEVHGLSESGTPSPLIERWKSGGFCDCGGWDVGCSVSILTENLEQSCTSTAGQYRLAAVSTHRTELIIQGKSKKNSPIFSLVHFNEGLFTVDFDESISVLQAFSICTAILHRRKPSANAKSHNSLQQQMFPGDIPLKNIEGTHGKAPAAYGTYHLPISC